MVVISFVEGLISLMGGGDSMVDLGGGCVGEMVDWVGGVRIYCGESVFGGREMMVGDYGGGGEEGRVLEV